MHNIGGATFWLLNLKVCMNYEPPNTCKGHSGKPSIKTNDFNYEIMTNLQENNKKEKTGVKNKKEKTVKKHQKNDNFF